MFIILGNPWGSGGRRRADRIPGVVKRDDRGQRGCVAPGRGRRGQTRTMHLLQYTSRVRCGDVRVHQKPHTDVQTSSNSSRCRRLAQLQSCEVGIIGGHFMQRAIALHTGGEEEGKGTSSCDPGASGHATIPASCAPRRPYRTPERRRSARPSRTPLHSILRRERVYNT